VVLALCALVVPTTTFAHPATQAGISSVIDPPNIT
jgi:hypothetical protein